MVFFFRCKGLTRRRAVISGVEALSFKHNTDRLKNLPQGGRLSMEMPVQISNVLLVCEACGQKTRTGVRFEDDGSKVRYCKKCSAGIGQISPPKSRAAK